MGIELPQDTQYRKVMDVIERQWIPEHVDESFSSREIWDYLGLSHEATQLKHYVAVALNDLARRKYPLLRKSGKFYRVIDRDAPIIPYKTADKKNYFKIKFPFELEKYVNIYPRNVIIVGGVSNQGKTTFVHNTIALNWRQHKVILFDSENSAEELNSRLSCYPDFEEWPDDLIRDRSTNFEDAVGLNPSGINIIDYLEVSDEFWKVGAKIRAIRDALSNGVAIIVLQKGEGAKLPVGGQFSRGLTRLMVLIDKELLTIKKGKARAIPTINPDNMMWSFKIDATGTKFINIERFYGKSETEW